MINALSVDVEEYYHGVEFEAAVPPADRRRLPSRVELAMDRVLGLLAEYGVRATCFVVASVARAHPEMVRRIVTAGHEIACHGLDHQLVWRQGPDAFRADVQTAKAVLEDIAGTDVIGYRAPNYSLNGGTRWALDILLEEGFRYDSSVYPILHDRYGDRRAPRFPYEIRRNGRAGLIEFPLGTVRVLGVNLPIGGGGYFRLFPTAWIEAGIRRVNVRERKPVMFYFHPWELDPDQPRPPMPWHHRFRHYVNLDRTLLKLSRLLAGVRFAPAREVLGLGMP